MPSEHLLTLALRSLLEQQRTAALGTQGPDDTPFVSMVPFALDPAAPALVLHVSSLAAHTVHLRREPRVSLLVCQAEVPGEPVHALPRVTLQATARLLDVGTAEYEASRQAYLSRFPEAEPMTALGDFRFVRLDVQAARQVAGFGAARSLDRADLQQALGSRPDKQAT